MLFILMQPIRFIDTQNSKFAISFYFRKVIRVNGKNNLLCTGHIHAANLE